MVAPKYGASVDLNQKEIVDALKQIGCTVVAIGTPVDLLVGYRKHNFLIEVKRPGEKARTATQRVFLETWPGQVRICSSPEEAIRLVSRAYR